MKNYQQIELQDDDKLESNFTTNRVGNHALVRERFSGVVSHKAFLKRPFVFNIDVISACSLRCPSCPQGQFNGRMARGLMKPELLERILDKARHETVLCGVHLYNWAEPFLHPKLSQLVELVNDAATQCYLSTNLNQWGDMDAVLDQQPHSIRISCSGFTQTVYEKAHKGGDIETVKNYMARLSAAKSPTTHVHLLWHQYPHNEHESSLMEDYCARLGFAFVPAQAYHTPLETVVEAWAQGRNANPPWPLHTSLEQHQRMVSGRNEECSLQMQGIALDANGSVQLCCGVFDQKRFTLGNYLEMPIEEVQRAKFEHSFCEKCVKHGGHLYVTGRSNGPELQSRRVLRAAFRKVAWILPPKLASHLAASR
jgi:hypothetical protein